MGGEMEGRACKLIVDRWRDRARKICVGNSGTEGQRDGETEGRVMGQEDSRRRVCHCEGEESLLRSFLLLTSAKPPFLLVRHYPQPLATPTYPQTKCAHSPPSP